ncbi:PucR family transcriptional regulator ligand-binding domain-containing protein [Bacillus sp. B190/17]|uniref:PucR family transcriptional regulator ligand-binding domain-containing protein n=1 Tax=Bacillus lumedeiriae TaxID=3058829 RepID=A0ABW8IAX2_9BACI
MITVGEAIHLSELTGVKVHAGKRGLSRKIRWAHVIDHDDMRHFLEGGELLLTCGQVWPQDHSLEDRLLKGFLRHQISGIIFATGRYLKECPPAVLEFGQKYAIPILEVPFHLQFVKITHAIHQEIMKREFRKKELTAQLPSNITEELRTVNSSIDICRILSKHFRCTAVITDSTNKVLDKSIPTEAKRKDLSHIINELAHLPDNTRSDNTQLENEPAPSDGQTVYVSTTTPPYSIAVPLQSGEKHWGTLWLIHFHRPFEEVRTFALEYAAMILLDIYLNQQQIGIAHKQLRAELMELLLENPKTASIVMEDRMQKLKLIQNENWIAGFVLPGKKEIPLSLSLEMDFLSDECTRWIDQREEINGFCEAYDGKLTLLISSNLEYSEMKKHLKDLAHHVQNIYKQVVPVFVFGEKKPDLLSLAESYHEANTLTPLVQFLHPEGGVYFADESRRNLLLYGGMSAPKAQDFRKLILPEELLSERGSVLYETLKCLALHNYNRESVAKTLHIHRNTLRYRIDRIEQYLQDSLSSSRCQFWIQAALDLESLANQSHEVAAGEDKDDIILPHPL